MSDRYLLDASALLALIGNEPGAEKVAPLMSAAAITAVNLAEVVKKLSERGVPPDEISAIVSDIQLPLEPGPENLDQVVLLGRMAAAGRRFGLSMGDAICLSVASWSGRIAVTTEKRWKELPSEDLAGAQILTVR